jgi:hypothetical protein
MRLRSGSRLGAFLVLVVLCADAAVAGATPPPPKPPPPPPPKEKKPAEDTKPSTDGGVRVDEAEALRKVLNLIATAECDYDGHRAKAEEAVRATMKELENDVKQGTAPPKPEPGKEDPVTAAVMKAADQIPTVKDKQTLSDHKIAKALAILGMSLQPALKQNKQTATQKQAEKAIDELSIALKLK